MERREPARVGFDEERSGIGVNRLGETLRHVLRHRVLRLGIGARGPVGHQRDVARTAELEAPSFATIHSKEQGSSITHPCLVIGGSALAIRTRLAVFLGDAMLLGGPAKKTPPDGLGPNTDAGANPQLTDADGDEHPEDADCDDNDPLTYPGAVEAACDTRIATAMARSPRASSMQPKRSGKPGRYLSVLKSSAAYTSAGAASTKRGSFRSESTSSRCCAQRARGCAVLVFPPLVFLCSRPPARLMPGLPAMPPAPRPLLRPSPYPVRLRVAPFGSPLLPGRPGAEFAGSAWSGSELRLGPPSRGFVHGAESRRRTWT